jgi:glycosyltransferase involved in cell wall biosynthesis
MSNFKMNRYKIIVAHSSKQHSFHTANALNKQGYLYKYITTVYDKPMSWTRLIKIFLKRKDKQKATTRRNLDLDNSQILQFCELRSLFLLFIVRLSILRKLFPNYRQNLNDTFGKKVAYYAIKEKVDAVITYDTSAFVCFKILQTKAPQIRRILDMSIANQLYLKDIYKKDAYCFSDSCVIKEQKLLTFNRKLLKQIAHELLLSDYFLVGSHFVKKSLEYNKIDNEKIYIVPYGVNINKFHDLKKQTNDELPLKLIFVGGVSYRKGIHHLLDVVSQFSEKEVQLTLVGRFSENADYYKRYVLKNNIHFMGFVIHDVLANIYNQADVFVLPSLAEGFAQVSLEAMSCGLPVICTENSGCNDAVIDFINGFVIQAGDRDALRERIEWFILHKSYLLEMSNNARKTAVNYTWEHYYSKINLAIEQILSM